jgi:hypothetical protein
MSLWQLLGGKPLDGGRLPHPLTREYMYAGPGAVAPERAARTQAQEA